MAKATVKVKRLKSKKLDQELEERMNTMQSTKLLFEIKMPESLHKVLVWQEYGTGEFHVDAQGHKDLHKAYTIRPRAGQFLWFKDPMLGDVMTRRREVTHHGIHPRSFLARVAPKIHEIWKAGTTQAFDTFKSYSNQTDLMKSFLAQYTLPQIKFWLKAAIDEGVNGYHYRFNPQSGSYKWVYGADENGKLHGETLGWAFEQLAEIVLVEE